jgi:predicted  nucleic acid-binding Zn-ribbon protein
MSLPPAVDAALKRLSAALDQLDAATERRARNDLARSDLEEELAVMQDDRTRLAVELDGALAQTRAMAQAHETVARRLAQAKNNLRAILPPSPEEGR